MLDPKIIEELKQLKANCDEIKGWLDKLEEKKSSVRLEVYQRVKDDYIKRLSELERKASGLLPQVEAELANLRKKLDEVGSQKEELNVQLEELALRKELGELSEDEFTKRSSGISELVKNLDEEETSLTSSVNELDSILKGFGDRRVYVGLEAVEEKTPEKTEEAEQKLAEIVGITVESEQEQAFEESPEKVVEEIIEKETEEPVELSTIGEILEEIEEEKAKLEPKSAEETSKTETLMEPIELKSLAQEIGTVKHSLVSTEPIGEPIQVERTAPSIVASLARIPGPKVVYSDGKNEYAISIDAKVTVIGSSDDADVVLKFSGVAPRHAEITKKGNRFILRDLGSREGVYLGGQRVKGKVELNHLDVIKVGSVELKVFLED